MSIVRGALLALGKQQAAILQLCDMFVQSRGQESETARKCRQTCDILTAARHLTGSSNLFISLFTTLSKIMASKSSGSVARPHFRVTTSNAWYSSLTTVASSESVLDRKRRRGMMFKARSFRSERCRRSSKECDLLRSRFSHQKKSTRERNALTLPPYPSSTRPARLSCYRAISKQQ